MRVLVTGGAGYIGSVVSDELLADGHEVLVYDNLYKGHRDAVADGARFVQADLLDGAALRGALEEMGAEAVIHLAADSLVGESIEDPSMYYRNNVQAGLSLLDSMKDVGVKLLVFSSTVSVYGEPEEQPILETAPLAPVNPYGETKLAFERALRWYGEAYGLRYVSLRYFNAAGATERRGERHRTETHLIPIVLQAAAGKREEVTIFGDDYPTRDGTCVRDYIHVADLARAHTLALESLGSGHAQSRIFNLGCGDEGSTVREVIQAARRVTRKEIKTRVGPRRPGDPARLIASAEKIASELGWRPSLPGLDEIVDSAWRWLLRRGSP